MRVVVGAGPVGSSVARQLAEAGEQVRIVTRSGSGPEHNLIERVAADAADAERLTDLTRGASVLYNCVNMPYTKWASLWPPVSKAMVTAARTNDAVLAITGNLYGYGPQPGGRMTEETRWPQRGARAAFGTQCGTRRWRAASALLRYAVRTTSARVRLASSRRF